MDPVVAVILILLVGKTSFYICFRLIIGSDVTLWRTIKVTIQLPTLSSIILTVILTIFVHPALAVIGFVITIIMYIWQVKKEFSISYPRALAALSAGSVLFLVVITLIALAIGGG